jgi:uncharacterized cupin superfamily protein
MTKSKISSIKSKSFVPASHEDPKNPGVLKKVIFNSNDFDPDCGLKMLNYAVIKPGRSFRLHYHETLEEVFYILEGKAEISINSKTSTLTPHQAVIIPRNSKHKMTNTGKTNLVYLVFGASSGNGATVTLEK